METTPMSRILRFAIGAFLLSVLIPAAQAQGVVNYPPADGMMYAPAPVFPAPGGFGGNYAQTYPSYAQGGYYATSPNVVQPQPGLRATNQLAPRVRGRAAARGARTYNRGYSQPPAPYSTALPQGQIYWPGSALAPNYTPFSRYQGYGGGYGYSPYGSGYYTGYYKGFSLGY